MRYIALVTLAFVLTLRPVLAAIPVFDEIQAAIAQNELVQTLKSYVVETEHYLNDVQELARVEAMLQGMIQHPSLGAAEALMGQVGLGNPLGGLGSVYSVMALTSGLNGGVGTIGAKLGQLGAIMSSIGGTNVYDCTDQTYACQTQRRAANSNAGTQGILGKVYSDLVNHYDILSGLRADLASSTDPAQRENIMAALQSENAWATQALGQVQIASMLHTAAKEADVNRADQEFSASRAAFDQRVWGGGQ